MNKTSRDCTPIEQLILKNQLEKLNAEETSRLNEHIEECPDCRDLHLTLSNLHKSLAINETTSPLPRPEIHLLLQQKMREIRSVKEKSKYSLGEIVTNILRRPIPLYQVAIVLLLTVCTIIYALNLFNKNIVESEAVIKDYTSKNETYEQYINYFPDRVILLQKAGINVAEDTSFKSILFSAL